MELFRGVYLYIVFISFWFIDLTFAQSGSSGSCLSTTYCFHSYDPSLPCQCNSQCHQHGNCCPDYDTLCLHQHAATPSPYVPAIENGPCLTFKQVTEALWTSDVNRLDSSQYTLNLQTRVSEDVNYDRSSAPLFSHVDEAALNTRPTFRALMALQDNYIATNGRSDTLSSSDKAEINTFLNAVLNTKVMAVLLHYLTCQNLVSDASELRSKLYDMWFKPYARSGGQVDSSGFEHVMVGEYKSSSLVNGLHNWVAYYVKERNHQINYYGYINQKFPNLIAVNFNWNGRHKALGSMFVGTSPEFEMALFTLCAMTHESHVLLNRSPVTLQVWDNDHVPGLQIASAYPVF